MKDKEPFLGEKRVDGIQWDDVYQRLNGVRQGVELGWTPSIEQKIAILKARARDLAIEPESQDPGKQSLVVVEFLLAHEQYAIELDYVREVYPLRDLSPLPCLW